MEQKPILYTYGNIQIRAEELIHLLLPHHINCVVDCRPQNNSPIAQNTPTDELKTILKQYQIIYLPFFNHFGFFSSEVRNKKGEPVYRKVIQAENFLQGIEPNYASACAISLIILSIVLILNILLKLVCRKLKRFEVQR